MTGKTPSAKLTAADCRLETPRLSLRPMAENHFEDVVALYSDAEVMRYINKGKGRTRAESRERMDAMIRHWADHGFGMWALFHKETGAFVGRCGLCYLDKTSDVELGYTLHKQFWRQGLATEASRACLRFGFDVVGLQEIVAITTAENIGSQAVMRKLGMTFDRIARYYETEVLLFRLASIEGPSAVS
jgi:RimJ/RimL family protein N-acetyltransferase